MISKDRIFKRGDVIVSGYGNVRIFTGECEPDVAVDDGCKGVFYEALTPYCESDAPAGTDMRYARHATAKEKKRFFQILKANRLVYHARTCTIKAMDGYDLLAAANYQVGRYEGEPMPFKVVKKREYPTMEQVRLLENEKRLLDETIATHVREKEQLREEKERLEVELLSKARLIEELRSDTIKLKNAAKVDEDYVEFLLGRGLLARIFNRR